MKSSIIIVSILVATFLQADGRSIYMDGYMSNILGVTVDEIFVCAVKMGVTKMSQLPQLHYELPTEEFPRNNSVLNEFWGCLWKNKGIFDEQGDLHDDKLESYVVDPISVSELPDPGKLTAAHNMVVLCKDIRGNDYGQTAVMIQNCINGF